MSRLNIFLLLILAGLLIFAQTDSALEEKSINFYPPPTTIATPTATPTPTIVQPASVSIPKIQVAAPIEPVGTDENGKMQLPQDINVVGWYSLGSKPGEAGNAVIAGHLDSATGEGAIFYNLKIVEPGDEIIITDQTGKENRFTVTDKVIYPYDQVPIDKVFGKSSQKRLNLITCTGAWNPLEKNYSHRTIIFSQLLE
ncbi:class F sortase [Candidatus Roizmanbacteria bacterium]|nr:class F sortase [Candidatus Roizmanbacteria bacterium]